MDARYLLLLHELEDKHIPQWPGATDEQLAAVANDLEEIVTQWDSGDRAKT